MILTSTFPFTTSTFTLFSKSSTSPSRNTQHHDRHLTDRLFYSLWRASQLRGHQACGRSDKPTAEIIMSQFRSSQPDVSFAPRGGTRWDSERFELERDRARMSRFDEPRTTSREIALRPRPRERSVDDVYERRGPKGYEEVDYHRDERFYDEEPRYSREPSRPRGQSIKIELDRERDMIRSPSPPRRAPVRPGILRRQSSLDTFDRKPFPRREEYGPPARLRDVRPPEFAREPLPYRRALPPPRRYDREIEVAEPDFYGDDNYRPYPERVREREIIRTRRRSTERSKSREKSVKSSRSSSSSSSETEVVVKDEFPKKGKTRMPARLVHKHAIIQLGYPFEEEVSRDQPYTRRKKLANV